MSEQSKAKLQSCLSDLGAVSNKFKDALEFGFSQLNASASKPRIKPCIDVFLSTSHNISEVSYPCVCFSDKTYAKQKSYS